MPGKTKPDALAESIAERLRVVYMRSGRCHMGARQRITRRLNWLAKAAGVATTHGRAYSERPAIYLEASARGFGSHPEAEELLRELAKIERHHAEREKEAKAEAPKASGRGAYLYTLAVPDDTLANLGLVAGDEPRVYGTDDLKPGDAAALHMRGDSDPTCGRVVSLDAETITLRDNYEDWPLRRADVVKAGRLDLLNVGRTDPLTPAERKRVAELRGRLDRVDRDDITNSTAAMKLERELYDLEHPKDVDDWSAWEAADED